MDEITVKIKKLFTEAKIPQYKRAGDAGFDFYCIADTVISGFATAILPTGLAMEIPDGYEIQIRLRSSIALNTPLIIPNAPGTIDSGYRGEIGILIRNCSPESFLIKKGERIAQGVLNKYYRAKFNEVLILTETERGDGGFGSTD